MVIAPDTDTDTLVSHLYEWRAPHLEADIKGSEKLIQANSIVEIKIHYIVTTKFSPESRTSEKTIILR